MNTRNNIRFQETEKKIKESLLSLLSSKGKIDSISMTELCKKSEINRKTFYSHYQNPLDVLNSIKKDALFEVRGYMANINGNAYEKTTYLIRYMKEKKNVFHVLLNTADQDFIDGLIGLSSPIFDVITSYSSQKNLFQYVKSYTLNGAKTIIMEWMDNDFKEEDKKIAKLIVSLTKEAIDLSFRFKEN